MVALKTKVMKAYPDPDPPNVARIDAHAGDETVEPTRLDQETARRAQFKLDNNSSETCLDGYVQSC